MRNEDISEGLQELLGHASRLSELSEKLLAKAKSSERPLLARRLERLRDGTREHIAALREHEGHGQAPAPGAPSGARSVAGEDAEAEDQVTESSMESFPASDAPGGY